MPAQIRKLIVQVDETRFEMGRPVEPPTRKALAMAVIDNPCAGRYVENLDELIAIGEELGGLLGSKCVQALGIAPGQAHSYGKAAIVGEAGELEHAAAILHPKLGAPLRQAVEKGAALQGVGHAAVGENQDFQPLFGHQTQRGEPGRPFELGGRHGGVQYDHDVPIHRERHGLHASSGALPDIVARGGFSRQGRFVCGAPLLPAAAG